MKLENKKDVEEGEGEGEVEEVKSVDEESDDNLDKVLD
jgi:hypothetical protein